MKTYPLEVDSVGEDTYIVMSRGHHEIEEFMAAVVKDYRDWNLGGAKHVWVKTTPGNGNFSALYHIVPDGTRGAWPATYCWEYGAGWEKYSEAKP